MYFRIHARVGAESSCRPAHQRSSVLHLVQRDKLATCLATLLYLVVGFGPMKVAFKAPWFGTVFIMLLLMIYLIFVDVVR